MDIAFITELFAPFGAIDVKRMFGGYGLSADGVNFGLVIRDLIYLKTDNATRLRFEAEGCAPFSYQAKGRPVTLTSYWRMPERLYDDPDELAHWAREALGVARRTASAKVAPKRKSQLAKTKRSAKKSAPKPTQRRSR